MAVIAEGSGKIPEGPSYRWSLEVTDNGSRVKVSIKGWSMSRSFPTVISSESAEKQAADLAASLGSH